MDNLQRLELIERLARDLRLELNGVNAVEVSATPSTANTAKSSCGHRPLPAQKLVSDDWGWQSEED